MDKQELVRFAQGAFRSEVRTAAAYLSLASSFGGPLAEELRRWSGEETGHSRFWTAFLQRLGAEPAGAAATAAGSWRYVVLSRLLGVGLTLKWLERGEHRQIECYGEMLQSTELGDEEKGSLRHILESELFHEERLEAYSSAHKFFVDKVATMLTQLSGGLVSVLSVSAGAAGVQSQARTILVPSLIVGVSGVLNTLLGFYVFERTAANVKKGILSRLKGAVPCAPWVYGQRLAKWMERKGFSTETARRIADEAEAKPPVLARLVAEEEYGISEAELGQSLQTAGWAAVFRAIGAVLPLLPYLAGMPIRMAIPASILISMATLVLVGFLTAVATELDIRANVLELAISGLVLAALTFLAGRSTALLLGTME